MATALVALATTTLASSSATVTFSSLPTSGYRDLRLVINGATVSGGSAFLTLNGDTAANYSWVRALGDGSTAASSSNSSYGYIYMGDISSSASITMITCDLMDYSATDKHKTALSRANMPANYVFMAASRWASTSAVTTVAVSSSGGNFTAGTTFSLFGIVA